MDFSLQELTHGLELKTFKWNFVRSIEPPRVVHVRVTDMMSKENLYAQVTVRLFTQQVSLFSFLVKPKYLKKIKTRKN